MTNGEPHVQRQQSDSFLAWQPTDWAPRQRTTAIRSLLLLTCSCGLIAGAFWRWGTQPLAMDIVVPIGMLLLYLGALLLCSVFWYAYQHGHYHLDGEPVRMELPTLAFLWLAGLVAFVALTVQLVGVVLAATTGTGWQTGWRAGPIVFLLAGMLIQLFAFMLSLSPSLLKWRPTRDPTRRESVLTAPVTGMRLTLRGVVMLLAQNVWLLIGAPVALLFNIVGAQFMRNVVSPTPVQEPIAFFGAAAAFFLLAALSELTHHG